MVTFFRTTEEALWGLRAELASLWAGVLTRLPALGVLLRCSWDLQPM